MNPNVARAASIAALFPCLALFALTGAGLVKSAWYLLALVLVVTVHERRALRALATTPAFAWFVALTAWWAASHLWSLDQPRIDAFKALVDSISLAVFFLLIAHMTERRTGFPALAAALISGAALVGALLAVGQYLAASDEPRAHFGRLLGYGQLRNPVLAGTAFGFVAVLAATRAWSEGPSRQRVAWIAIAIACMGVVLATGSRAPCLAVVLALFPLLPAAKRRPASVLLAAGVIVAAVIIDRPVTRPDIWLAVLADMEGTTWLVGHGAGTTAAIVVDGAVYEHPHNLVLSALFFTGIAGVLILLGLLVTVLSALRRVPPREWPPVLFGPIALLADGGVFIGAVDVYWLVLWLPMAMALGTSRRTVSAGEPVTDR